MKNNAIFLYVVIVFFGSFTVQAENAVSQCSIYLSRLDADGEKLELQNRIDFLREAERKLKKSLEKIRESSQELLLQEQGYKHEYYKGFDLAREFNAVAEYLQEIEADSNHTHISYFADQLEKTITDFEKSFRKNHQNNFEFLEERLKLLEAVKKEARKRIEDKNVTYDWFMLFHLRLIMITLEYDFILKVNQKIISNRLSDPAVREKVGIEISYNKKLAQDIKNEMRDYPESKKELEFFQRLKEKFERLNPSAVLFEEAYTSEELEKILSRLNNLPFQEYALERAAREKDLFNADNFNQVVEEKDLYNNIDALKTHEKTKELLTYFDSDNVGLRNFIRTKENFPQEIMFFTTSELGIMAFNELEDESYFVGISGIPKKVDSNMMDSYLFFSHDLGHIGVVQPYYRDGMLLPQKIYEKIKNISNKSDREKVELILFLYRHEFPGFLPKLKEYYAGVEKNLSQFELRQLTANIKKSVQFLIVSSKGWFHPDGSLHMMLPESVNTNDKKEVERFLVESADIFSDILLDF